MTMLEVLSHLARGWGEDALQQIKGMHNWVRRENVLVLPFMDDAISIVAFGSTPTGGGYAPTLQADIEACISAELGELEAIANARDAQLKLVKGDYAQSFQDVVQHFRSNPLTTEAFTGLWMTRFNNNLSSKDNPGTKEFIANAFGALHEFELAKLKVALANLNYNALKHQNDLFDAEQLIYLGDPSLHFVTIDAGYRRKVLNSPQRSRIHQVKASELDNISSAEAVVRQFTS
jgi:hypothetical protein